MPTIRLVLEYDGTDFHGWQWQPSQRTVEGVLRDAILQVTGEAPRLSAAGRTDAGAHAHGQVVGLPLDRVWEPARLGAALNARLPDDVAVTGATTVAAGFHARHDAVRRTYRYLVVARGQRSPLVRRVAWTVSADLDVDAMREAAALLRGTHDLGAFGRAPRPGASTVRTVHAIGVRRVRLAVDDETWACIVEVSADAFLAGMMRTITGALVAVGQGRMSAADIAAMLGEPRRPSTVTVAPARGLHQWRVTYPVAPGART